MYVWSLSFTLSLISGKFIVYTFRNCKAEKNSVEEAETVRQNYL